MSLETILKEDINYWKEVGLHANNRLLNRTASRNIQKRMKQMYKLKLIKRDLKIQKENEFSKYLH